MTLDYDDSSIFRKVIKSVELLLFILNQMFIGFILIYMSWLCIHKGLGTMELHAWLVTIGFTFLMAEGVMCHYNGNVMTFDYRRSTKTNIHWILQVIGGSCGVAGALIMLIPEKFHFHTIHGKLGFSAFLLCLISMMTGLIAMFSKSIPILRIFLSPLLNKTVHTFLGIVTFVIASLAQFYGYHYFRHSHVEMNFLNLLQGITITSLILTCIGPLKSFYQYCRSIMESF